MVLIDVLFEIVTAVGAALLVKVAVPFGTVGEEGRWVPVCPSAPGPVQGPPTCGKPTRGDATSATPADHARHFNASPPRIPDGRIRFDCIGSRLPKCVRDAPRSSGRTAIV